MGSLLHIHQTPEIGFGGDTLFANMHLAYEMLSEPMKAFLDGLTAVHDGAIPWVQGYGYKPNQEFPVNEHPVVIRHPLTGRKSLFVNRGYTTHFEGWTVEESLPLLQYLFHRCERPEYQFHLKWQPGTVAFWDNLQVLHYAVNDYHGQRRVMQRTSVAGVALDGAGCTQAANTSLAA